MSVVRSVSVQLPEFHADQLAAYNVPARFLALRCGRRWGKTKFGSTISADQALKGFPVGWFAPEHRFLIEPYAEMIQILGDAVLSSSEMKGQINVWGGGKIDVWSLDNPLAGRGRKYKLAVMDEIAFAKPQMVEQWRRNIRPTLVDLRGSAIAMSNTNGVNTEQFFYQICNDPAHQFIEYHAPSSANPYLPPEELEELRGSSMPLVWQQEYMAEFVDWSGVAFFSLDRLLVNGEPVEYPPHCDTVFAIVDSATKTGRDNDGTAVVWFAWTKNPIAGLVPLVILDWDVQQIEGASLTTWLPTVFSHGEELARQCKARYGSSGALIEDKSSGMVLLQHARNNNWPANPIESKLTAMGKSERAINASGPVFTEKVKLSRVSYEKTSVYKGASRNHLVSQVTGFRVGAKDMVDDDLLDSFCYGVALSLGNAEGF